MITNIFIYIYICACVSVHVCLCMCIYIYICACVYIYLCACVYIYISLCMCIYISLCMCIHTCTCTYTCTCTTKEKKLYLFNSLSIWKIQLNLLILMHLMTTLDVSRSFHQQLVHFYMDVALD